MPEITRPDNIRRQNRAVVLSALRAKGQLSRTEIKHITGLSAATISTITADLLNEKVLLRLEDTEQLQSVRGRPRVALTFNPKFAFVATIVLQLNEITASIVDYQGYSVFEQQLQISTVSIPPLELLRSMVLALKTGLKNSRQTPGVLKHITLGVQGTTDVDNTMLLWSPITPHTEIPLQSYLEQEFGIPVSVHNDCNMIARALRWNEPQIYNRDFAAILLSHGIGMGLYHNGDLVKGKNSSATEFGHMVHLPNGARCRCGRDGCIEAYAGDYAIYRKARGLDPSSMPSGNITKSTIFDIVKKARNGNPQAKLAFKEAGEAIGAGLASLFALIDSFPIAFVGADASACELLEDPIRQQINGLQHFPHTGKSDVRYYPEECPLIRDGCALTALMAVDENIPVKNFNKTTKVLNFVG